ncbi:kinetochore-microtubule binding complex subunit SPC105 [Aspergillus undulatus]|uniref:kinetochore-microtubule binding complex subunit SPC105 n=1 Tax=Aspergillus undulatus TaxID=1810928 RepID=UPI003CCE2FD7
MASRADSAGSLRPRSRRSIAHVSRSRLTSQGDKENETTEISAARPLAGRQSMAGKEKKSRSKSLGPGGLDALQNTNGNRRKSAAVIPLKSILKPTAPVSPVRNIPTFEETRRKTPARGASVQESSNNSGQEGLLIDFDTPAQKSANKPHDQTNPFDTFNTSNLRDEMAAAREQEERERRERERKAAFEHREARRKSMANRRVSFAPEATLHTWNVVEIPDDSTSSSASNSTRRASTLTNSHNQQPAPAPQHSEPSSSPEKDAEFDDIAFSPVHYPDLEQYKNRSAGGGYDKIGSSQEMSSSPFSGSEQSEDTGMHSVARDDDDNDDGSSDSGFDGESTAMSLDNMSVHSGVTAQTDGTESTTGTSRLNDALRQAAREAGTRSFDDEDDEEVSMEIADQEITGAFRPWIAKGQRQSFDWEDISARHDQENVDPSKQSTSAVSQTASDDGNEDLSMEVTNAIGGIISNNRQSLGRRKSSGQETNYDEQTMEFTNVVGGIAQSVSPAKSTGADSEADNEEMTMEFTSVVGGVLNRATAPRITDEVNEMPGQDPDHSAWDNQEDDMDDGADMEITGAVGGILPAAQGETESVDGDQTAGMDFTAPMGKILTPERASPDKADSQLGSSPFQEQVQASPAKSPANSPTKSPVSFHVAAVASESGSPSLANVRSRPTRQSLSRTTPSTPTSMTPQESPVKKPLALPTQLTQADRPSTPGQTPPSRSEEARNASPQKLFQNEVHVSNSRRKSPGRRSLFGQNAAGESAPLFVLRPPGARRSSGLGIDREGLGSPKVAAMLDKRRSIGEEAGNFVPQEKRSQGVRFEDPLKLQEEVDREREEEESREDGHIQPSLEPPASLRDMISSLTPKKDKIRGRKSLHVGAARGILGKRPAELDLDDEDAEATPKRLRRPEDASPVKNVRLPPPPTKEETVGRAARSPARKTVEASPLKVSTTPTHEPRGVSVLQNESAQSSTSPEAEMMGTEDGAEEVTEPEFEPIQLQDFLNMTNIHFMELTTTKRRHTTAPDSVTKRTARLSLEGDGKSSASKFDDCVAAGFCTVPMLELYQHSCRELKSYISEGRQIIRSIETETYSDNPPLFREYVTAAPDIRLLMDNQFRNVKTHTRLLSKATWYEWRMKLLEGLKEGLDRHMEEMKGDDDVLSKHEKLLNDAVPALATKHSSLEQEATNLQHLADELENCDQDELWNARGKLSDIEEEIVSQKKMLEELQTAVQEKTDTIETGAELKAEYTAQIQEAERVKEECRGWSAKEIRELKDSVHRIEQQTGWSISSASSSESEAGPVVTMSYRRQLQLKFHPRLFRIGSNKDSMPTSKANTSIEVSYSPESETRSTQHARPLSSIALLILKSLQAHVTAINQSSVSPKQLLRFVSEAWDLASKVEEEARMLGFHGVTNTRLTEVEGKPSLRARCTLLGTLPSADSASPSKSRVDIDFAVTTRILEKKHEPELGTLDIQTEVLASKVYGFGTDNETGLSEKEMRSILNKELKGHNKTGVKLGSGVWSRAVQMLSGRVF